MGLNSAWTRLRAVFLWRPFLSQLAVLLALDLAIHATLLFRFDGYLSWGNFDTAFVASQYPSGPALYWSPFQYNGAPVGLGFADLSNYIEGLGPLTVLSDLLGATWGAKAFILLSTWFVGGAALLLARTVIRRPIAQLAAAVFLIGGPFQLALYGQGDYQAFVAEGFVFLSLYTLWLGIRRPTQRWVWFPTAAWLLVLTFQVPQAFLLGFVLTAGLVPLYVRDWRRSLAPAAEDPSSVDGGQPPRSTPSRRWGDRMRATYRWVVRPGGTLSDIGGMLARLPGVVGVAAVIIIPAYVTFYILGTGATGASSGMALPLSTFSQYSRDPLELLVLNGYFNLSPTMVRDGFGAVASLYVWYTVVLALLALVWVGYLFTRERRLLYLLVVTVLAALIGAGTAGPLSGLSVFLYLRVPGYAALNASYYWDWFVLNPLDALMVGLLLQGLLRSRAPPPAATGDATADPGPPGGVRNVVPVLRNASRVPLQRNVRKGVALGVVALLTVGVLLPIANGAYYSTPDGISEAVYPADYAQVPGLLNQLIGNSYAGVALFNPDVYWLMPNTSHAVPNAFFLYPTARTPGLPVYLAPSLQSNSYFYWLYDRFYSNETRYAAQLFALVGVEYFLVFYGTQSASFYPTFLPFSEGKNASVLLEYQRDIVPVVQERSFAIYRDLAFNGVALADSDLSLVAGPGYDELNALAYAGVNLDNQSILFPGDLPSNACTSELNRVQRAYTASPNALIGIALQCDHVSVADPLAETNPTASPTSTWVPSTSDLGVAIMESWPTRLAVTEGGPNTIRVPVSAGNCTVGCSIWLPIRFSGDGGALQFGWNGAEWGVSTAVGYDQINNTMVWVQLPFAVTSSNSLSITGSGGWNAVGSVYVFSSRGTSPATSPTDWVNQTLAGKMVIPVAPASLIDLENASGIRGSLKYVEFPPGQTVNEFPGNQGIVVSPAGTAAVHTYLPFVKPTGPGWVGLLARATSFGYVTATFEGSPQPELVGFNSGNDNGSRNLWQTIMIPWNSSTPNLYSGVNLSVDLGTLWLAEVWFVPQSIAGSATPTALVPPSLGPPTVYAPNSTVVSSWSARLGASGFLSITANGTFSPATAWGHFLLSIELPNPSPPDSAIALSVNITSGLWISANDAAVSYRSEGQYTLLGPLFQNAGLVGSDTLTFDVDSYGNFPAENTTFNVSAQFAYVDLPLVWNVSDLADGPPLSVSGEASGYQVAADGAPLVLVRVSDYPGLVPSGTAGLGPALGTLDTLLWNPSNQSSVAVVTSSTAYVTLGLGVSLLATAVWVGVEIVFRRYRARSPRPRTTGP